MSDDNLFSKLQTLKNNNHNMFYQPKITFDCFCKNALKLIVINKYNIFFRAYRK